MVFIDTSALFALLIPSDIHHQRSITWIKENESKEILTTDYILDELYTLILKETNNKIWTIQTINRFNTSEWLSEIVFITQEDFLQAQQVFMAYDDKGWSFTDCTSKIIIERLGIPEAFAFDQHFNQFGNVSVVPIV